MGTSGQQNVARCSLGQVVSESLQIIDVVEDEYPASVCLQPFFDGGDDEQMVRFVFDGQVEHSGEVDEGGEQFGGVGAHPEDIPVLVAIAVGVFQGGLGLADAAQPANHLSSGLVVRGGQVGV